MKTTEVYAKTMKFVWLRLGLGMAVVAASAILLGIIIGIGALADSPDFVAIGIFFWAAISIAIYAVAMHYFGYMLKAAHIAVVSQAVTTGVVPEDMVKVGKDKVIQRFGAANTYLVIDRLISGAVNQLQKGVGAIDNVFGDIPGVSTAVSFLQMFIGIALGYIDECCLGYTFLKEEEGAFKAGCDGVVIYFQNIKTLLKSALTTSLIVIGLTFVAWLVPFILFAAIFAALKLNLILAIMLAIVTALALKYAFVDSFIMVKTMVAYMEVAPSTVITFDLYDKLCKLSSKFKSLFTKAQEEGTVVS